MSAKNNYGTIIVIAVCLIGFTVGLLELKDRRQEKRLKQEAIQVMKSIQDQEQFDEMFEAETKGWNEKIKEEYRRELEAIDRRYGG